MKLHYIGVLKNEDKPAVELCSARIYPRWQKDTVDQFMNLFSKTVAERTRPGQRQDIEEHGQIIHVYARNDGLVGIIMSDQEYPALPAHRLLSKYLDEFSEKYPKTMWGSTSDPARFVEFKEKLVKYLEEFQDPKAADSLMKIQQELDDTKIVLHKTIESVLERGEKLDTLVAKSDGLSMQSRMFYTASKRQNSCCTVM